MTTGTDRAPDAPDPAASPRAMRPLSLDWLGGEVTLAMPRWAFAAAGLAALVLIAVALD
ncbi:hypothetical protein [Rhodovulum sp. 12E13]|uniref:hypothetical protein n=1 Tax=Rhodovulum sp. 12E13 TaxID=2203891 RepID=UPI001314C5F6|nr:hypothetical protein [Rhodovulum sp. 12E13]